MNFETKNTIEKENINICLNNLPESIYSEFGDRIVKYCTNSPAFLFSTEHFDYFTSIDVKNKTILSIAAGSGDNMLTWLANGAKHVDLADFSLFPKYVTELKLAAIQNLSRTQFKQFFNFESYDFEYVNIDPRLYDKIKFKISDNCKYIFDKIRHKELEPEILFHNTQKYKPQESFYLENDDTFAMYKTIAKYNPRFIWSDISNLNTQISNQYDIIYLSNAHDINKQEIIRSDLKKLDPLVAPGGIIMANYFYECHFRKIQEIRDFYSSIDGYNYIERKFDNGYSTLYDIFNRKPKQNNFLPDIGIILQKSK